MDLELKSSKRWRGNKVDHELTLKWELEWNEGRKTISARAPALNVGFEDATIPRAVDGLILEIKKFVEVEIYSKTLWDKLHPVCAQVLPSYGKTKYLLNNTFVQIESSDEKANTIVVQFVTD